LNHQSGSQWRKWDLHVHTPESIENHYRGNSSEEKWALFLTDLERLPIEVKVLGINDYLFIDGYRKILDYKAQGRLANIETIFPVIEFRVKKFAGNKDFRRVNFHVIFSDDISCDTIQNQFLNTLQSKYKLAPGITGIEWNASITADSLADLGRRIKATVPLDQLSSYGPDLVEGFNNLNLDEEEIIKTLRENSYLKSHHVLAVGKTEWDSLSWGESSIAEKKDIINKVDLVFISSATIVDYNRARDKLIEQEVNSRLLDCSDAHYLMDSDQKDRIGKCYSWVKADPTFKGLKQAILEFEERVYIGEKPAILTRVHDNPTKYIQSLKIEKLPDSTMPEIWFDRMEAIPFNSQLVTIIGNKGSGKSALADIIGLIGNSQSYPYNSFLTESKFLKKRPLDRASSFSASLIWNSGLQTEAYLLSSAIDESKGEKVKYLPQNYLEKICSDEVEGANFEQELKAVVFSHMSVADRLGKRTFDEYLDYRSSEIRNRTLSLQTSLHLVNKEIAELEYKLNPAYLLSLEEKIKGKREELFANQQIKPTDVQVPADEGSYIAQNQERYDKLALLQDRKKTITSEMEVTQKTEATKKKKIAYLGLVIEKFSEIEKYLQDIVLAYRKTLLDYSISIDDIIKYEIDLSSIRSIIVHEQATLEELENKLDPFSESSLYSDQETIEKEIVSLVSELSEPSRKYQKYLEELEAWKKREEEIVGNLEVFDSLTYFENELEYIKTSIKGIISLKEVERSRISQEIYNRKKEIIKLFESAYEPVMRLIDENEKVMGEFRLSFDAMLKNEGFEMEFLERINQGVKGTFCGKDDGFIQLKKIMEVSEFGTDDKIDLFLKTIIERLSFDFRENKDREKRYVPEQLRKDISACDFYDFLYGLDYLIPSYRLRLGSKELIELSPGERGALLLIFYLLLDKSEVPLIIDQPEENLDNQSVYDIVVKFIKKAKDRRQVIIVTHNPNLAVVCDSDQVIRVRIDKENQNAFSWIAGSIENKEINDEIVRILEGTMPAFWNRRQKYENVNH
jgi:energy-coupling factor transporter ATP-binding protein EcfA2